MPVAIEMPKPGVTVEECLLVRWLKSEGDSVAAGEAVAEIETDKASFEIPSPAAGVLLGRFFPEGELVPVYTAVGAVGEAGENIDALRPQAAPPAASASALMATVTTPTPAREQTIAASPLTAGAPAAMSPRARRFAEEHRFPVTGIAGSGPGGRILEQDVKRAFYTGATVLAGAGAAPRAPVAARPAITAPPPGRPAGGGLRERIARRMRESLATTAQYTLHSSAEATGLLAVRARVKAARQNGAAIEDVNLNDLVMFCTVRALERMPELNAEYVNGELRQHEQIHLGFACDTPRGLLAPVIRNCEAMGIEELSRQVRALSAKALEGKTGPDELTGATFTVSNLGSLGIESFTPIVNPPQVAILGVDTIEVRPVRKNGTIEFVDRIGLSLTLDHQVIDGAPGARFLQVLRECVEDVEQLVELAI